MFSHQRKVATMSKTLASFVGLLALVIGATVSAQTKADSDFKVTLLGTGTPIPDPARFGPSTLVEAGNKRLLFDAGRGVPIRVRQLGFREGKIDVAFLLTIIQTTRRASLTSGSRGG